jgi:biotin carboxyl carrier protein
MAIEVVEAPIPGKIIAVNVSAGNHVDEGDVICLLESMKMENPILSPVSGSVKEVNISPNQVVKGGYTLVTIEY